MAFAKDYREEITLSYYCFNSALAIVIFVTGTIYLKYRDRRDQKRREREDREYQEGREREDRIHQQRRELEDRRDYQRREWRQFAERIYCEYSKLKAQDIPQKLLLVKNTFENIQIHSEVTGLDVLRYMLADVNYHFASESPQLKCLREDLHTIFLPLNVCSSLLLLGEVPENIKGELRHVVDDLGNVAKPFFAGEHRRIILKCLEHFGGGRSRSNDETERRVSELDSQLESIVPYVNNLQFGGSDRIRVSQREVLPYLVYMDNFFIPQNSRAGQQMEILNSHDYGECSKFSLNVKAVNIPANRQVDFMFLVDLHADLQHQTFMTNFARYFREQKAKLPLKSIEQISDTDSDEVVLVKVLHEVRCYIHLFLNEDQLVEHYQRVESNINRLRHVHEEATKFRPIEDMVKSICQRFIGDLEMIHRCPPDHCKSKEFYDNLSQLYYVSFCTMIQAKPRTQVESYEETHETNF